MQAILNAKRDARIDALRGLALMMIFIDHLPGNALGFVTLHVYGFADAAEIFVLFAGFASMLAYGRIFLRDGPAAGAKRIGLRCARIYATHALLLMATLVIVRVWSKYFHVAPVSVAPLLDARWAGLLHGLALHALPGYLDILPLYIVLLAVFPLMLLGFRVSFWGTLAASGAVWLATQIMPQLNLPNWLDPAGWYFDPFSWQLLFAIGAALAIVTAPRGGALPKRPWLTAAAWLYLGFAFLQTFPTSAWGLPPIKPFAFDAPDKTHLSLWRILDILAWTQIVFSAERTRAWAKAAIVWPLEACGRHSLDIFALGCLLALMGRLVFRTFGRAWPLQVGVNLTGLILMALAAVLLEARSRRKAKARTAWQPAMQAPGGHR